MNIVKDLNSNVKTEMAVNPTTIAANGTTTGNTIDRGNYDAVEFTMLTGTRTDGTYTWQIFEGDAANMSDEAQVTDANSLVGTAPVMNTSNAVAKVGYRGRKQFVRAKCVASAVTTGCTGVSAVSQKFGAGSVPAGGL